MSRYFEHLIVLRAELAGVGLNGFLLATGDEHITEYPAAYAKRLEWLTGFKGSTASAVVLMDRAALFVDGRYTVAARDQVDGDCYQIAPVPHTGPGAWLAEHGRDGDRIGYDPRLHTRTFIDQIRSTLAISGVRLVPVATNPLDRLWLDQPGRPLTPIFVQPIEKAGRSSDDKRCAVADLLKARNLDASILVALDSIAWLLNIRASDVEFAPLAYAFGICWRDGSVDLFVDESKLSYTVLDHLGPGVRIFGYDEFYPALESMAGRRIAVDPDLSPIAVYQALAKGGAQVRDMADPTRMPKAIKNPVEIEGMKQAHLRDGAALTQFLHWLSGEAPKGRQTEMSAAERLAGFRRAEAGFHGLSFPTISAADANAALPHYEATAETDRPINPNSIYLVDSGGQYSGGTTDVTRTVAIGDVRKEIRDRFTRVLKGHIAIARLTFPAGTMGFRLDPFARRALWEVGLDYALGTGHGVGHFLNVHEGPAHMLATPRPGDAGIEAGMILSNEPGYYKEGDYGIRIENLVVAVPRDIPGAMRPMLGFETITIAPIDRMLIDTALLTDAELDWLNDYHATVLGSIGPLVPPDVRSWLEIQTSPIGRA
ncbi:MAG TPA: aminopeptidase P family protein [Sphingopyxis sp.]|uniref:aminopeptidase P family protein n=1 Tax=Sphingopyxis sp. TaxID=1908224 RepID=UPI002BCA5B1C|nr:aminopeptidase P family protein [Sphingopyxis sp.]HWW56532.1 aminopeptidase P family protein [Sphingopyxis sp.]